MNYFYKNMSLDINDGIKNYVIERRTPVFKFYADLDIFDKEETPIEEIKEWIADECILSFGWNSKPITNKVRHANRALIALSVQGLFLAASYISYLFS